MSDEKELQIEPEHQDSAWAITGLKVHQDSVAGYDDSQKDPAVTSAVSKANDALGKSVRAHTDGDYKAAHSHLLVAAANTRIAQRLHIAKTNASPADMGDAQYPADIVEGAANSYKHAFLS